MSTDMTYFFIVAIAIITAIGIIYILYAIYAVNTKSVRLKILNNINSTYENRFIPINQMEVLTYNLSTKPQFDRFNPTQRLNDVVSSNLNSYRKLIDDAKTNTDLWIDYKNDIRFLPDTQFDKFVLVKIENEFIKSRKLKQPVVSPSIKIVWTYTSPKGRNSYSSNATFSVSGIISSIRVAELKTTRQAQIAAERSAMTSKLRYKVMERDHFRCVICGSSADDGVKLHVDHIFPVSKGGKTEMSNLRTLCDRCNLGKGAHIEKTE